MSGTRAPAGNRLIVEPLPWETRNLGVESFALSEAFLAKPDARTLKKCLADLEKAHGDVFVQARFNADTKTSQILEGSGFYFVEATVCPHVVLSRYAVLERFVDDPSRFLPGRYPASNVNVVAVAGADRQLAGAVTKIAGESFVLDRFHVDHNCDRDTADRRYVLWVDDLFRDGAARFHALLFRKQPIAFMASRGGDLLLAGFARTHASGGLGEFFWLRVLQDLRVDGVNRVSTTISVNNISAVNLYARLSFKFREPRTTFHLWVRRRRS